MGSMTAPFFASTRGLMSFLNAVLGTKVLPIGSRMLASKSETEVKGKGTDDTCRKCIMFNKPGFTFYMRQLRTYLMCPGFGVSVLVQDKMSSVFISTLGRRWRFDDEPAAFAARDFDSLSTPTAPAWKGQVDVLRLVLLHQRLLL